MQHIIYVYTQGLSHKQKYEHKRPIMLLAVDLLLDKNVVSHTILPHTNTLCSYNSVDKQLVH